MVIAGHLTMRSLPSLVVLGIAGVLAGAAGPARAQYQGQPQLQDPAQPQSYQIPQGAMVAFPNFAFANECARRTGPPRVGTPANADYRACIGQEMYAHDQLLANWPRIPASVVLSCLPLARGTGFGSYAVLATCIQPQVPMP